MTAEFSKLGISEDVVRAIDDMGWTEPTPVQVEAIPVGLDGTDLIAQAQTGTGKTGAFGSIILDSIDAKNGWAHALVLLPTRELAVQVAEELEKLSKYTKHKTVTVYGGVSMLKQTQAMDKGVDIIVATPGRLCDHLKDDERLLDDVSVVVLDEADRMLDMGFRKDLEFILARVPEERQTMMFSATMPYEVKDLAKQYLTDPKIISVSKDEVVLDNIRQSYMEVEKDDKIEMLRYILAKEPMKTIVFCYTKYRVEKVVRKLKMSFKLAGLHGEYTQNRREEVLEKFKEDSIQVLIATDLAARGLDINDVMRVINLDLPAEAETYVHRIGRTGRAGKEGQALSFVMHDEKKLMKEIENITLIPIERIEAPGEDEIKRVCNNIKTLSRPAMAKKNSRKNDVPVEEKEYILAEINLGKEEGQTKASIAQLIRDYTDVPKKSIGNIMLGDKTSTLEVETKYLDRTTEGIRNCSVNGKTVKIWKVAEVDNPITETLEIPPVEKVLKEEKLREIKEDRPKRSNDQGRQRRGGRDGGRPWGQYGSGDRPRKSYGGSRSESRGGDRPKRSFEDRPRRDGERPRRSFDNDRPRRQFSRDGDRPRRNYDNDGDRPRRNFDRGGERPRRSFGGDRPKRSFEDRPRRDGERPRRSFDNDRPRRQFSRDGDRSKRSFDRNGDRPRRSFDRGGDRRGPRPQQRRPRRQFDN